MAGYQESNMADTDALLIVTVACAVSFGSACSRPSLEGDWELSLTESGTGLASGAVAYREEKDGVHVGYRVKTEVLTIEPGSKDGDMEVSSRVWRGEARCGSSGESIFEESDLGWGPESAYEDFRRAEVSGDGESIELDIHYEKEDIHEVVRWRCAREFDVEPILSCIAKCTPGMPQVLLRKMDNDTPDYPTTCEDWHDRFGDSLDSVMLSSPFENLSSLDDEGDCGIPSFL